MTTHCANPSCAVPVGYLRDGRLFQFEIKSRPLVDADKPRRLPLGGRQLSHFWLCGRCSSTLTLVFDVLKGIVVKPR